MAGSKYDTTCAMWEGGDWKRVSLHTFYWEGNIETLVLAGTEELTPTHDLTYNCNLTLNTNPGIARLSK